VQQNGGVGRRVVGEKSEWLVQIRNFQALDTTLLICLWGWACNVTTSSPANSPSLVAACQPRDLENQIHASSLIRFRRELDLLKIR